MVHLAHRQRAHQQIHIASSDLLATGRNVISRRRDKRDLGRVLTVGSFVDMLDQSHAHRPMGADVFEHHQRVRIAIHGLLQLRAVVTNIAGVDKDGRNTRVDHGGLQRTHAGHFKLVYQIAGGKHRPTLSVLIRRGIHELDLHFGRRKGHAIELEVTGLLHFAIGHGNVGNDGLADIGLPDAHHRSTVFRHPGGIHQTGADREGAHCGGQIAAIATPVDERLVDGHLAEQVIHVVIGLGRRRQNHRLAGAGRCSTHAIGLLAVGIGTADHPQQQIIPRLARHLRRLGQVLQAEENTFTGTATHIGGGYSDLRGVSHGFAPY